MGTGNDHACHQWEAEDPEVASKVRESCKVHTGFWSEEACAKIEADIESLAVMAKAGHFREKTVDRTPLRSKYFFGYGYTYGSQISKKGDEQILPPELIDPVPDFIYDKLILPLEEQGMVREGWINSAVVNDYRPGGMIVSHVDPPKLFARPIFISSFFAEGRLVFGSRFSFPNKGGPPHTTAPKCICPMPRGSLTIMDGFSADGITHGIRPQDLEGRRVSIVLRHVFPNAPRLGQMPSTLDMRQQPLLSCNSEPLPRPSSEQAVAAGPKIAAEEIDEFGRRRPARGAGDATDRQKAALARLQGRSRKTQASAPRSRSRSPQR